MGVSTETAVDAPRASGWPYRSFPTGWFQVAWLGELDPGSVRPLRYFGTDLVLFRAQDGGTITVADAFCPHQGAHLGYGGWVEAECIVCPYHGWQWGTDGENRLVPTEGTATDRRRLRVWPVRVTNGIVWVWYDQLGREPSWEPPPEVPEFADPGYYPIYPHCVKRFDSVLGRPQYMMENNSDIEHLRWVHRADGPLTLEYQDVDGPLLRASASMIFGYGRERTRLTPNGPVESHMVSVTYGIGIVEVRFDLDGAVLYACGTAVDDEHFDIFQTVLVKRPQGSVGDEPEGIAADRVREQFVQVTRDFVIWANMRYESQPPYARGEAKPMAAMRRWAAQFYPDAP